MRSRITIMTLIFSLFIMSCSKDEDIIDSNQDTNATTALSISDKIFILVNKHRKNLKKNALERSATADKLAKDHCIYMISVGKISHTDFNHRFNKLQQKVNAKAAGENVAVGYSTAEKVMESWLKSQGHKANIEGNFTHIGIAAVKDSRGNYYFTQLFYR